MIVSPQHFGFKHIFTDAAICGNYAVMLLECVNDKLIRIGFLRIPMQGRLRLFRLCRNLSCHVTVAQCS